MEISRQLDLLIKLQELDISIGQVEIIIESHPLRIKELEDKEKRAEELLNKEKERLESLLKDNRKRESDQQAEKEKIKKTEEKLKIVKTNKEYQAVLKELETQKKEYSKMEESYLYLLEEIDNAKKTIDEKNKSFQTLTEEGKIEKNRLLAELGEHEEKIKLKLEEREELTQNIDFSLKNKYQFIGERRQGLAVAAVRESLCLGCHMNIPPQLYNEVQKNKKFIYCPHCNRFLYWENNFKKA